MGKVFVSYCHKQGTWVWDCLVPCLKAGGTEVLIDRERFEAGKAIIGQMDARQNQADKHVLVLSEDYLNSSYCVHELDRAIRLDPNFAHGVVVPILRRKCKLPYKIKKPNPLYVDLRDDKQPDPWALLLAQCRCNLGTTAPVWLNARDRIALFLSRQQSVNLVVKGSVAWRALLEHLMRDVVKDLTIVNLEDPATISRRGLLTEILKTLGLRPKLPAEPDDLAEFSRSLSTRPISRIALVHFDLVAERPHYGVDLFAGLRYLLMDSRKLVLLVQSRTPFDALLPRDHPLSSIDVKTVELQHDT